MKRIQLIFLTLAVGLFASLHAAGAEPVDRLIALSGLDIQVDQIPDAIKSGFLEGMHGGGGLPDDVALAIMESADKTLLPSVIIGEVRSAYEKSLNEQDMSLLLAWYESAAGKAIADAEEKASRPEAMLEMLDDARRLLDDTARVETAERLDRLLGATDKILQMQKSIMAATYASMATAATPGTPPDLDGFKAQLDAETVRMRPGIHSYVIVSLVYTYRSVGDDILERYERFLGQSVTQKFNDATADAVNSGLKKIIIAWVGEVAAILKAMHRERPGAMERTEI